MKLHNLVNESMIVLDKAVTSKKEAISLLLTTFLARYPFSKKLSELEQALFDREALGGTSFPTGLSVPHARFDDLDDLVILILRPEKPIADPQVPIRLVVLMLVSQNKPGLYLNSLSGFLKLSQNEELFQSLLKAPSPREFLALLTAQDLSLIKILTVGDILVSGYPVVHSDQTIRELTDLFYTQHLSYAPVVDDQGHLVGEISLADVLRAGFPEYAVQMGDLKFLRSFEPLERLVEQEDKLLVREMMKPVSFGCAPSAPVIEVTFEFIQKGRRHCPVVQGRQLVGVLSIMDILSKVIRG